MSVCIDLSFIKFGNCKSPQSTMSVDVSSISKQVSQTLMETVNTTESNTISIQNQDISIDGSCCASLTIEQDAQLKIIDKTSINQTMIVSMLQDMYQKYSEDLNRVQPGINTLMGNNIGQQITSSIKLSFVKAIENESIQSSFQSKLVKTIGNQSQSIQIKCNSYIPTDFQGKCNITQEMIIQMEIINMFEEIFLFIRSDPQVHKAIREYTTQQINKTTQMQTTIKPYFYHYKYEMMFGISVIILLFVLRIIYRRK